ncbi:MAG: hypothetical protein ABUS56_11445 [Acidobacteriota bacterium]
MRQARLGRTISGILAGVALVGVVALAGCRQATPPQQQIDVVGVRSQLLVIGQAEGQYLATHSSYATLEQLQEDGLLTVPAELRGYVFTATVNGAQGFSVTATPSSPDKQGWPTLAIDHTMQVSER